MAVFARIWRYWSLALATSLYLGGTLGVAACGDDARSPTAPGPLTTMAPTTIASTAPTTMAPTTIASTAPTTIGGSRCNLRPLSTLTSGITVWRSGTLSASCVSADRRANAVYYSYRITQAGSVEIRMTSSVLDSYLVLRRGAGYSGSIVAFDDDGEAGGIRLSLPR